MPQQEMFFEQVAGDRRAEVLKTYDRGYAREAFGEMDEAAQAFLLELTWKKRGLRCSRRSVAPRRRERGLLWEELLEAAHEDGNVLSFFCSERSQRPQIEKPVRLAGLAECGGICQESHGASRPLIWDGRRWNLSPGGG